METNTPTTENKMELTSNEKKMIRNIAENDYANGEPDAMVWADCLDCGPCPLPSVRSHGGVIASLIKKGLVVSDGEGWDAGSGKDETCVWLTSEGLDHWRELTK
jgi:hypothetical protein